jgi:hypothetical protein
MIRRALLLTVSALTLNLVMTSLLSFANAVVQRPTILVQPQILEFILALLSPVTLIAFLLVLYWELSGRSDTRRRQTFALAAASGVVIHLGLTFWQLHETGVMLDSLTPEMRAQSPEIPNLTARWVHSGIWSMLPAATWITFLLIFWRDWVGRPIYTSWNLIILPAVLLAAWFAVPYFLFSVWRTPPGTIPPPHGADAIA